MADEINVKWLYPPNFYGTYDEPAVGRVKGHYRYSVLCTNYSDGTGEDDSLKVRRTDLRTPEGLVPTKLAIDKIKYHVDASDSAADGVCDYVLKIGFNNMNDEEVAILGRGDGEIDFTKQGGFVPIQDDPLDGGDIVFTTEGTITAGDNYTVQIDFRAKQ